MTTPLYIFDLDGTLTDLKHRRHFVEKPMVDCSAKPSTCKCFRCTKWEPNWDAFHAACVDDTPIQPVITTLLKLWSNPFTEVWIWSGRMETVREETIDWLTKHVIDISLGNWGRCLKMRPAGNTIQDHVLKESWLHAMDPADRARLVMTFDDRDRVVAMWRRNGIICAQVAPGDF